MSLHFKNDSGRPLWVAIAFVDRSCPGSQWRKEGWWKINPRSSVTVYTEQTNNQDFYYFAHDENWDYVWEEAGNPSTYLPYHAFSRCWDEPGGTELRRMKKFRAIADANDNYTRTLYI